MSYYLILQIIRELPRTFAYLNVFQCITYYLKMSNFRVQSRTFARRGSTLMYTAAAVTRPLSQHFAAVPRPQYSSSSRNLILKNQLRVYMGVHGCTWMYMDVHGCTGVFTLVHPCTPLNPYTRPVSPLGKYTSIGQPPVDNNGYPGVFKCFFNCLNFYTRMY